MLLKLLICHVNDPFLMNNVADLLDLPQIQKRSCKSLEFYWKVLWHFSSLLHHQALEFNNYCLNFPVFCERQPMQRQIFHAVRGTLGLSMSPCGHPLGVFFKRGMTTLVKTCVSSVVSAGGGMFQGKLNWEYAILIAMWKAIF